MLAAVVGGSDLRLGRAVGWGRRRSSVAVPGNWSTRLTVAWSTFESPGAGRRRGLDTFWCPPPRTAGLRGTGPLGE